VTAKTAPGTKQVDAYLAQLAPPHRDTLDVLRARLRRILPHATEALKYGMPTMLVDGKGVAGFAAFKAHCSYFPMSSGVLGAAGRAVAKYPVSKGGLRFPVDEPLPVALLRLLVKLRLAEIAAVTATKRRRSSMRTTSRRRGRRAVRTSTTSRCPSFRSILPRPRPAAARAVGRPPGSGHS
jgi:uncharacterized protein YdhG (YjbR/CyaY superfamily)